MKKIKLWVVAIVLYSVISEILVMSGMVFVILMNGGSLSVLWRLPGIDFLLASQWISASLILTAILTALSNRLNDLLLEKSRIYQWIYWS